jgi:N-terminal acetyltransferase B complex non-catalytic subunit
VLIENRTTQKVLEFLQSFAKRFQKSRNAHLALLDFSSWRLQTGVLTQPVYLATCQEYFDSNSGKLYCFEDVRKYAAHLDKDHIIKLVEYGLEKVNSQKEVCEEMHSSMNKADILLDVKYSPANYSH